MNVRYLILYITWILFPLGLQAQMAPDFTIFDKEGKKKQFGSVNNRIYHAHEFWLSCATESTLCMNSGCPHKKGEPVCIPDSRRTDLFDVYTKERV